MSVEAQELFLQYWNEQKASQIASTGQETALWRAGGRATKANPDKENEDWWIANGGEMVQRWIDWRKNSNWTIWTTPQGEAGIELALNIELGGVPIKMALDRLMVTPDGELVVLDLKSGRTQPSSDFQLGMYAVGIEKVFGIRPKYGTFWMARDGMTSPLVDLDKWTIELVEELVVKFDYARRNDIFLPNFNHCKLCSMKSECKYQNGENK